MLPACTPLENNPPSLEFVNAASVIIVLSKFVWYYIASYNITNVDLRQVLEVFDVDNLQGMLVENKL